MQGELSQVFSLTSQGTSVLQGEQYLSQLKKRCEYPNELLKYIKSPNTSEQHKLRAAIQIRLWCQNYADMEEFQRGYYQSYIEDIKLNIVFAYLDYSLKISKTLRLGIVNLANIFFPNNWNGLISGLLTLAGQNPNKITAILKLIQDITQKYTFLTRSDPLYEQIILVCNQTHDFLLNLTINLLQGILNNSGSKDSVQLLQILMKIFYNLNYQDLHPKFQDHLKQWMQILKQIMNLENQNENVFKCKGAALESILLYASKYKQDVQQSITGFCQQIWNLCEGAKDAEHQGIVFSCLKFFKSLILWKDMKQFFNQNMKTLITKLIVPNISLTSTAKELLEEQTETFIDHYFRNNEIYTRRAAAIQLLRVICRHYETFEPYLREQIQVFQGLHQNEKSQLAEVMLVGLIIDGSCKGFRDTEGCTNLFVSEEIITYCYQKIVKNSLKQIYQKMLQNTDKQIENYYDIMYISVILRYLFFFRVYLPKEDLLLILKFLTSINTNSEPLRKVIYLCINGFIIIKHGDFINYTNIVSYFNKNNLSEIAPDIYKVIFNGINQSQVLNQSLSKMLFNISKGLAQENVNFFDYQIQIVQLMLLKTEQYNFSSVQFLFQSIATLVYYYVLKKDGNKKTFQTEIMNFFTKSIKKQSDLVNFCLQILSIFIILQTNISEKYTNIYQSLLMLQNWSFNNIEIMPSYIQLITSYIARSQVKLIQDKPKIEQILTKIIQLDHIDLFYRFLENILAAMTVDQFHQSGYLMVAIKGSQAICNTSVQGIKSALLFFCKIIHNNMSYPQIYNYINSCVNNFYQNLLVLSLDIIKTISQMNQRKWIMSAICSSIITSNIHINGELFTNLINSLITNASERYSFRNYSLTAKENQKKEKKEGSYKKLTIFNEIEKRQIQPKIEEDRLLYEAFMKWRNQCSQFQGMIDKKNMDRMQRIHDKLQS